MRLCTIEELSSVSISMCFFFALETVVPHTDVSPRLFPVQDEARGSGCGVDDKRVWSSSSQVTVATPKKNKSPSLRDGRN